jgi:hypothetical protein
MTALLEYRLTEQQAAEHLGVKPATMAQWRHRRQGPRFFRPTDGTSKVRYSLRDLETWVLSRVVDPAKQPVKSRRRSVRRSNGKPKWRKPVE